MPYVAPTKTQRMEIRNLPAPEPAIGIEEYHRQREQALERCPRRRANFEKYLAAKRSQVDVDYLPIKLDIENVSRCNFRCTMCVVSDWHKGTRGPDMGVDDFKTLINEQYGLVEIKLQGIGEPLMQGDDFFEMIRYARSKDIWVRTTTNASLLHIKDNYKKLIDANPCEVQISVDGATEDVFQAIRRGSQASRVFDNCRLINAYCDEVGYHPTKMWTVVQESNQHQLEALVTLAHDLGFKSMAFSLNLTDWGMEEWGEKNNNVSVQDTLDPDYLYSLIGMGEDLGVQVRFWSVNEKYSTESVEQLCPWPFERAYMSSDNRVVPCCYIGNPDVYEFKKNSDSFSDVWYGDDFKNFRQAHIDGNIPSVCKGCYKNDDG